MAREQVRIYLRNGQIIEFVSDGFQVAHGAQPSAPSLPAGQQIGTLSMGAPDRFELTHIDLTEIVAITKRPA